MRPRGLFFALALGLPVFGCGREIVQTAEPAPAGPEPLECGTPPATVALPDGPPFGDGMEPASPLVGSEYGPEEGPGIYVTAKDRFRVYMNGELVREGAAPRTPEFVPLTVLPGDNVLAIVVAAATGEPSVLVQLDELEKTTVSDATWRVSTSPSGDFHDPLFDDSIWPLATDQGELGSRPGCDPTSVFPAMSEAHWIGAGAGGSVAVFRTHVRILPVGFGARADGGHGATPLLVETADELADALEDPDAPAIILVADGDHDFRRMGDDVPLRDACPVPCSNDPEKIMPTFLTGDETCPEALVPTPYDARGMEIGSNKTLVGLGRGASLRGVSLEFGSSQNIIVRNIALYDVNPALIEAGDAFGMGGAFDIWIDHCTAKWVSDGFTDARPGTQNVTVSWFHYDGANPDACTGLHPRAASLSEATVTIHHSFFDHVEGTSPYVDHPGTLVHLFNDFFGDNPSFAAGAGCSAEILLEGSTFEAVLHPTYRRDCGTDDPSLGLINAPEGSNLYRDDVGDHLGGDGMEPHDVRVTTPPYSYTVDPAKDAWPVVLARAGAGGPWGATLKR